jgi:hypothetical protein
MSERSTEAEPQPAGDAIWRACAELANTPRILNRMAAELERSGLVGEARAAKLIYLVLTGRFLDRPLCAVIRGQSSAGKSHLVERVLALFPASAYHFMTSMSPKALAYGEESLVHRILVVAEAAGLSKGDNALLLRSLISEGRIRHETVESVANTGLRSRITERAGPTGLLVTTTSARLESELETRMLSIPINDTPEQTSAIMMATALRWDGSDLATILDTKPWHALQGWLENAEHRVIIPYARRLARLIPPTAVRLRRDSNALMSLIAALNIFVVAEQFWRATNTLRTDDWRTAPTPPIVCAAFALELYLKCLIAMEGKKPPLSHDLKKLFRRLDAETQNEIRARFKPYENEAEELANRAYSNQGLARPPGAIFDFVLEAGRDAFEVYRYIHEKGLRANQGWGADRIMQAARRAILDRHPDWAAARQIAP